MLLLLFAVPAVALRGQSVPGAPPVAPIHPVIDTLYGVTVTDPYRYMENPKDPEVQAWMKAQDAYTRAVLASIPGRQELLARIRQHESRTIPSESPGCPATAISC